MTRRCVVASVLRGVPGGMSSQSSSPVSAVGRAGMDPPADPIRLRIVRHLAENRAATLPELAEAAGVHLNTARPHVQALEAAGVLTRESQAPHGRGRPAVDYRLMEGWSPPTTDFLGLAELL